MSATPAASAAVEQSAAAPAVAAPPRLRIIFIGTGVSTGIPVIGHFEDTHKCACARATRDRNDPNHRNNVALLVQEYGKLPPPPPPPAADKDGDDDAATHMTEKQKRQALQFNANVEHPASSAAAATEEYGWTKTVAIDWGKTARDAYFKVLAPRLVRSIDALVLTHEHADAILGMDDVRDVQKFTMVQDYFWRIDEAMPVFLSPFTMKTVQRVFAYIFNHSRIRPGFVSRAVPGFVEEKPPQKQHNGSGSAADAAPAVTPHGGGVVHELEPWKPFVLQRRVAALEFNLVDEDHGPFEFAVTPAGQTSRWYGVPVEHGANYLSLGFVFGSTANRSRVVYISDVSKISDTVMRFLHSDIVGPIDILVCDCLLPFDDEVHFSHYGCDQFWALAKQLDPVAAYGTGMWCAVEHDETCARMAAMLAEHRAERAQRGEKCRMEKLTLAYDGLTIELG